MVNNEFHIIGIATTNYQSIGNWKFKSYLLRVEVEKFGSNKGANFELEVQVYGTNKAVDVEEDMLGKQLAINGYIDTYATDKGTLVVKCVAQNVYVLESQRRKVVEAEVHTTERSELMESINESLEQIENPDSDYEDDDDLPF